VTAEAVVERFLAAQRAMYRGAPAGALEAQMAPGIVWHVPGTSPIAGCYRGREAVLGYFARRRALAGGSIAIEAHATLAFGDTVVHLADGSATLGGVPATWRTAGVYRVADGVLAEAWLVPLDLDAFDAVWQRAATGPASQAMLPDRPSGWSVDAGFDLEGFLARPLVARVAAAGPSVRPVWFLFEDGAFWWLTGGWSSLPALLARSPDVAVVIDTCDLDTGEVLQVTATGAAEVSPLDPERARRKLRRYLGSDEALWPERFVAGTFADPSVRLVRLAPRRLRARDLSF
jgi:ketosteroid isomerase-like protein/nitroimidazol reductase NimA-like FMN-containing flavoprotein (pyridoxamine 5'-phosphate oxidase superfamily)